MLTGTKVLDFSRLLPGPLASHMLVRLGCEIIKVESPVRQTTDSSFIGDYTRNISPFIKFNNEISHGTLYEALNAGKTNIVIDLKHPSAASTVKKLITSCDVLLEGNRPGVMKKLGLSYDDIKLVNKKLVYCSLTGYGSSGLYSNRPGHDLNYMALSGLLGLPGPEHNTPAVPAYQAADSAGALQAVIGILAGLLNRHKTGEGTFVDVSITESAMALALPSISNVLAGSDDHLNPLDGSLPNYNIYETKDNRYLAVGALEINFWKKFCSCPSVNRLDLIDLTLNHKESVLMVKELIATKNLEDWMKIIELEFDGGVCIEPILSKDEIINHPLHRSRKVFHPSYEAGNDTSSKYHQILLGPRFPYLEDPVFLDRARGIGEDTDRVLKDANFSEEEIHELKVSKVVY